MWNHKVLAISTSAKTRLSKLTSLCNPHNIYLLQIIPDHLYHLSAILNLLTCCHFCHVETIVFTFTGRKKKETRFASRRSCSRQTFYTCCGGKEGVYLCNSCSVYGFVPHGHIWSNSNLIGCIFGRSHCLSDQLQRQSGWGSAWEHLNRPTR